MLAAIALSSGTFCSVYGTSLFHESTMLRSFLSSSGRCHGVCYGCSVMFADILLSDLQSAKCIISAATSNSHVSALTPTLSCVVTRLASPPTASTGLHLRRDDHYDRDPAPEVIGVSNTVWVPGKRRGEGIALVLWAIRRRAPKLPSCRTHSHYRSHYPRDDFQVFLCVLLNEGQQLNQSSHENN
ncbi:hypothetical protein EDD17DRAFT_799244 [Pisolithus thermaeus]|nr:hypothetical protein EDD17DRAFT_799244 [Pisolithus thermaeus]